MSSPAGINLPVGRENKHYPAPLVSHQDVVKDSIAFWDTLKRFHLKMGTKFMIPVLGGKDLDLHVLYVQVTERGGYDKVVAVKKWREVGAVFSFSPTTTSASYVLRRHYLGLLYHYEQVHFFKVQGPLSSPKAVSPISGSACRPEMAIMEYSPAAKPIRDCPNPHIGGPSVFSAVGKIDGKFDCGYLVTVQLGSEVLRGVLYHPESSASTPRLDCGYVVPHPCSSRSPQSTRRKRGRRSEDPSYPKSTRSGYNFFFAEKHYKLRSLYPNRERELTKKIGQSWNKLSTEERKFYENIGLKDKERYKRELKEYKQRQMLRTISDMERAGLRPPEMVHENIGLKDKERYKTELKEQSQGQTLSERPGIIPSEVVNQNIGLKEKERHKQELTEHEERQMVRTPTGAEGWL